MTKRILLIGDIHLSATPPSARTETYPEDILAKVKWCAEYANEQQLDAVVCLGDVFHLKSPTRNPHWLVIRAAEAFQTFTGETYIVPGNHDVVADRMDSLGSQPLGSLALSPRIHLASGYISPLDMLAVPYMDDLDEFLFAVQAGTDPELVGHVPSLVATHQSIFPPAHIPPYPHVNADQIDTHGAPLAYGHIHDPHDYPEQINGTWFCNNGAISRGSLHEETVKREPKVTVFEYGLPAEVCPFTPVDVPHRLAADVFRLAEAAEKADKEERLDEFLERVGEVSLTSLSLEAVLSDAQSKLEPEAVTELQDIFEVVQ